MSLPKRSPEKAPKQPDIKEFPEKFQNLLKSSWSAFEDYYVHIKQQILSDWLQKQKETKPLTSQDFEQTFLEFLECEFKKNQSSEIGKAISYARGLLDKNISQTSVKLINEAQATLAKYENAKQFPNNAASPTREINEFILKLRQICEKNIPIDDSFKNAFSLAKTKLAALPDAPIEIDRLCHLVQGMIDANNTPYDFATLSRTTAWGKGFVYPDGEFNYYFIRMLHELGELYRVSSLLDYSKFKDSIDIVHKTLDADHSENHLKILSDTLKKHIEEEKKEDLSGHITQIENIFKRSYDTKTIEQTIKALEDEAFDSYLSEALARSTRLNRPLPSYIPKNSSIQRLLKSSEPEHKEIDNHLSTVKKEIEFKIGLAKDFQTSAPAEKLKAIQNLEEYREEQLQIIDLLETQIYSHFWQVSIPEPKIPGIPIAKSSAEMKSDIDNRFYVLEDLEEKFQEKLARLNDIQKILLDNKESFPKDKKTDPLHIVCVKHLKPVYDEFRKKSPEKIKNNALEITREQYYIISRAWSQIMSDISDISLETYPKEFDKLLEKINKAVEIEQVILKQITEEKAVLTKNRESLLKLSEITFFHNKKRPGAFQDKINARKKVIIEEIDDCKSSLETLKNLIELLKTSPGVNLIVPEKKELPKNEKRNEAPIIMPYLEKKPARKNIETPEVPQRPAPVRTTPLHANAPTSRFDFLYDTSPSTPKAFSFTKMTFSKNEKIALGTSAGIGISGTSLGLIGLTVTAVTNLWNPIGWTILLSASAFFLLSSMAYGIKKWAQKCCAPKIIVPPFSKNESTVDVAKEEANIPGQTFRIAKKLGIEVHSLKTKTSTVPHSSQAIPLKTRTQTYGGLDYVVHKPRSRPV